MGGTIRAGISTISASFTDGLIHHGYPSPLIKINSPVSALLNTFQTTLAGILVYPGHGNGDLCPALDGQFKGLGSSARCLCDRVRNVFRSLAGSGQKDPARCTVQWTQFGMTLPEKPVFILIDSKNLCHFCGILTGLYGSA